MHLSSFYGWYAGAVFKINPSAPKSKCIRVKYDDGDIEDLTPAEFDQATNEAAIEIAEVGWRFVHKIKGSYWSGKVIQILESGKRICEFTNGVHKQFNLAQLLKFSREVNTDANIQMYDDDEEGDDGANGANEVDDDSAFDMLSESEDEELEVEE